MLAMQAQEHVFQTHVQKDVIACVCNSYSKLGGRQNSQKFTGQLDWNAQLRTTRDSPWTKWRWELTPEVRTDTLIPIGTSMPHMCLLSHMQTYSRMHTKEKTSLWGMIQQSLRADMKLSKAYNIFFVNILLASCFWRSINADIGNYQCQESKWFADLY